MFKRLLKHQFKSTYIYFLSLYLLLILGGLLLGSSIAINNDTFIFIATILFTAIVFGTISALFVFFYKFCISSMFGKRGYLTFSIPVSPHQLVLSKILAIFIYSIGFVISAFICFYLVEVFISPKIANSIFGSITTLHEINSHYHILLNILLPISNLISFIYFILLSIFAFTFANSFSTKKRRGILAFLFLIIISSLVSIMPILFNLNFYLVSYIDGSLKIFHSNSMAPIYNYSELQFNYLSLSVFILHIIFSIIFYVWTIHIMKHSLELE